jgi:hypothetical protein
MVPWMLAKAKCSPAGGGVLGGEMGGDGEDSRANGEEVYGYAMASMGNGGDDR